jgi:hypothetical protein
VSQAPDPSEHAPYRVRTNSRRAMAVMYLGMASVMTLCLLGIGLIPAVVALVQARKADAEIAASHGALTGSTLVAIGRTLAIVTLVIAGVVLLLGAVGTLF